MRFTITHLFALTAFTAALTAMISAGEMGWSLIPILAISLLFFLPRIFKWKRCPAFLKTRYHMAIAAIIVSLMVSGVFESFGWWQLPFSNLFTFFICPGILFSLQLIKFQTPAAPNLELRIAQIVAIWLPTTMVAISFCYNTI